jgi:hypothetical protein
MFILCLWFLLVLPVFAQDVTTEPAATVHTTATVEPVVTLAPTETPAPVVIEQPSTLSTLLDKLFNVLLLLAVVFLAFKQANLIPPAVLDSVMVKLFEYGKAVTATIPGDADDTLLSITEEVIRRWIKEEQAKQNPTTPSVN